MYRWELDGPVLEALDGLPRDALLALQDFLTAVVIDPWDFRRTPKDPVGVPLRMVPFGNLPDGGGAPGQVTFLVYDRDQLVLVTAVQWLA